MKVNSVLVVDDSSVMVKLMVKFLLQNNINNYHFDEEHVYTASDGMEAFESLSSLKEIDLIVSDVNMPMLNGDELLDILIDTNRLSTIEVILVTNKETADQLSKYTLDNVLGVICKPFNKDSFAEQFNGFLEAKQQKLDDLVLIQKENQTKQELSLNVIVSYLEESKMEYVESVARACLSEQFGFDSRVLDEDIMTLLNIVLEEYFALNEIEEKVDSTRLRRIYVNLQNPKETFSIVDPFKLQEGFEKDIKSANSHIESMNTLDAKEILTLLFKKFEDKLSDILTKVNKYEKIDQRLLDPFFPLIIETLSDIDTSINDYELQKLQAEYKELISLQAWLKPFYQKSMLYNEVPKLKSDKEIIDQANKRLQITFKYVSAAVLHYTGAIEQTIWLKAKASAHIMRFFRANLTNQIPNSKNMLLYLNKIPNIELREYEVLEKESVLIVSNFLETLQEIKNNQGENLPLWQIQGFSKVNLIEAWLTSNTPTKMILDYDFNTPTYANGLEYLFYLRDTFPDVRKLISVGKLFILCSNAKVEELRENKDDIDFVLISKPLKASEVKHALLYS